MKKERMITRTIKNNNVKVKLYNTETDEISETYLDITGNIDDIKVLQKACENRLSGSDLKVLKICDNIVTEKLYGMSESMFMLYAVELDPRTKNDSEG